MEENSRLKLKWHLPALDYVICLQRKRIFGWRTVSWIYPSIVVNDSLEQIKQWLLWDKKVNISKNEKAIDKKILSK